MKAKVSFKLVGLRFDDVAFDTLRTSDTADRAVQELAEQVRDAANKRYAATVTDPTDDRSPYVTDDPSTVSRGRRTVWTDDFRANYVNARQLTLINALGDVEGAP